MCEHADLAAMVGFVGKHIAEHFRAWRPGRPPAIPAKLLDATAGGAAKRFFQHFGAANCAQSQCRAGLPCCAVRALQLRGDLQVRGRQPDPFGADVVHVREDRGDGASFAGRFGEPGRRVKLFDEKLVHAIIGGEDADRGAVQRAVWLLAMKLGFRHDYGSQVFAVMILPDRGRFASMFSQRPQRWLRNIKQSF